MEYKTVMELLDDDQQNKVYMINYNWIKAYGKFMDGQNNQKR